MARFEALDEFIVLVGPKTEQKKFTIPRTILTKSSAVLRAYCEQSRIIRLEDVDVDVFSCYLQWLYTGKTEALNGASVTADIIPLVSTAERWKTRQNFACDKFECLLGCAFFAHEYKDTSFLSAVIKSTITVLHDCHYIPSAALVRAIYDRLPADSGVRRMVLDRYFHCLDPDKIRHVVRGYAAEFFLDVWAAGSPRAGVKATSRPSPKCCERYLQRVVE